MANGCWGRHTDWNSIHVGLVQSPPLRAIIGYASGYSNVSYHIDPVDEFITLSRREWTCHRPEPAI